MFKASSSPSTVLSDMERVFDLSANSGLRLDKFENEKDLDALKRTCEFLSCSEEMAIILSVMIYKRIFDSGCNLGDVIEHLMLKNSDAPYINEQLRPFVKKDWISPQRDPFMNPLTIYNIHTGLIKSVLTGKAMLNEAKPPRTSMELINLYQRKLERRKDRVISYDDLLEYTNNLLETCPQLEISSFISEQSLNQFERLAFLYGAASYYNGNEDFDISEIFNHIQPPKEIRFKTRNEINSGEFSLLKGGLFRICSNNDFLDIISQRRWKMTEQAIRSFDKDYKPVRRNNLSFLVSREPETISATSLIFERQEQQMVNKLGNMLVPDKFRELQARMQDRGMKPGISVLIYGSPGTGKTETVLQLARQSGRSLLMAEANRIRSKWVGETEKNIKALFEEYRAQLKESELAPILLFNEADAIISRRQDVKDRGDQMENSLQNIILEELENFQGIFIATTNLVENFDKAFDRRFLYKLKLEKPGPSAMMRIWKNKFPDLKSGVIKKVCSQFTLTGGQIENIRKKILVDGVLDESMKVNEKYLLELIEKELIIEKTGTRSRVMGFVG